MSGRWIADPDFDEALAFCLREFEQSGADRAEIIRISSERPPSIKLYLSDAKGKFAVVVSPETVFDLCTHVVGRLNRKTKKSISTTRLALSNSMIGLWSEIRLLRNRAPAEEEIQL